MRASTSTLEMYNKKNGFPYDLDNWKKGNKSRSLAKPKKKKKKIGFLGDDSTEELWSWTPGSINHLSWHFNLLQWILT